ncbi:uncharacterized protein LOC116429130 isoform X2 [Nomia melanderi]|uniref:uncharacterized protein LOC116429130 isoform X2 n=1 Tax=Nomia melanderi TaxID=2448451 RepID=UPI003FCCCE71
MKEQGTNSLLHSLNPFKSTVVDQRGFNDNVKLIVRPLRIFQFLVVLLIFVFVIYAIATGNTEVSAVTCILLIVLSGVYVFVLAVELISHFGGGELHAIPIFVLSILGVVFFGVAGILLIPVYIAIGLWYIVTTLCLCLLAFTLFLIDVIVILAFWKQACRCEQCIYPGHADVQINEQNFCHPLCDTMKYDLMTSVSSIKVPSGEEDGIPVHCYRKIGHARRRQYVDRPTSAKSRSVMDIAKCQTESPLMTNIQSQTQYCVTETPTQTVSKCELCHRQMEIFSTSADMQPICQQQPPCAPCPALVQLIRGTPCCPGCRCVAGIVQVPQQSHQQQTLRQDQEQLTTTNDAQWPQQEQRAHGMLTSEREDTKMMGVSGTITKLTVASYCVTPSRRSDMSCQTVDEETRSTTSRRASDDADQRKEKPRLSATQKEQTRELSIMKPEVFILEGEKEKVRISVGIEKETIKHPSRSGSKSSTTRSVKLVARPSSIEAKSENRSLDRSVVEDQSETVMKSGDPALVSPPLKVAQMIDLLQEIEGAKGSADATEFSVSKDKDRKDEDATRETERLEVERMVDEVLREEMVEKVIREVEEEVQGKDEETEEFKSVLKEDAGVGEPVAGKESSGKLAAERVQGKSIDSDVTASSADESVCSESRTKKSSSRKSSRNREVSVETLSSPKLEAETQATDTDRSSSKSKKISFPKKRNKIEPYEQVHSDIQSQTWCPEPPCETGVMATSRLDNEKFITDKHGVLAEVPICPSCRRIQHFSVSPSTQYYSVYRDKRGRLYCKYCSPLGSIKVLYKHDACEQRSLKCSRCRNLLNQKSSRIRTDTCPKCAQTQFRSYLATKK